MVILTPKYDDRQRAPVTLLCGLTGDTYETRRTDSVQYMCTPANTQSDPPALLKPFMVQSWMTGGVSRNVVAGSWGGVYVVL